MANLRASGFGQGVFSRSWCILLIEMASVSSLSVERLHVWRGDAHVLRGLSFSVQAGQLLEVRGANGSGKTTLLRSLCGLVHAEEGRVRWCGTEVARDLPGFQAQLAYLGHDGALKGDLTGEENIAWSAGLRSVLTPTQIAAAVERVGASAFSRRLVRTLSAGQRRRLALATVLLAGAALWLFDEPTTNLDDRGQALVGSLITEHLERAGTVVAAVHQPLSVPRHAVVELELP
jgi:heme exporter protein A